MESELAQDDRLRRTPLSTEWRSPFKAAKWAEEAKGIAVAAIRGTQVTCKQIMYAKFKNCIHSCTNYVVHANTYVVHAYFLLTQKSNYH